MSQHQTYTVIPDVLSVTSNLDNIHYFSFGFFNHLYQSKKHQIKARFTLVDTIEVGPKQAKFDFFYQVPEGILYEHGFFFGKQLRFLLRLDPDSPYDIDFVCERDYYDYIKLGLESVSPPALVFYRYILAKMLEANILPLHCSAVSYQGDGTVFIAPSNTGKSFTAFGLVNNLGCQLLTEDVLAVQKDQLKACHSVSVYSSYIDNNSFLTDALNLLPKTKIYRSKQPFYDYFSSQKTYAQSADLKNICILQRGEKNQIEKLAQKEAANLINVLNEYEFQYHTNSLSMAEHYFNRPDRYTDQKKTSAKLIASLVKGKKCWLVTGQDHEHLYELAKSIVVS